MTEAHVLAVDVSPSRAYIARVYKDGRTPDIKQLDFPEITDDQHDLKSVAELGQKNARTVAGEIVAGSNTSATMVVMSKLLLFDLKKDPSGPRRAGLWWDIVNTVVKLELPIAELTPMTGQFVLTGRSALGTAGFQDSERGVKVLFPDIEQINRFRYYTVAQGIAGATALGWSSPAEVDYKKLRALRHNVGNSFPVEIPKTVEAWETLNKEHKSEYVGPNKKEMVK